MTYNTADEYEKTRKLLNGFDVKDYDKPIDLVIHTKAPGKWKLIDLETGEEYIGSDISHAEFSESLRQKITTSKIGSWIKTKKGN